MKHLISHARNSHPEVFSEKDVLNNLPLFTGEHLCWSPFLIRVAPVNIANISRTPI